MATAMCRALATAALCVVAGIGTASTPSQPKTNTADAPAHLSPRPLFKKNKKTKKKHAHTHTHKAQEKEEKAQAHTHKAQEKAQSTLSRQQPIITAAYALSICASPHAPASAHTAQTAA
jgi:hypothetical protein